MCKFTNAAVISIAHTGVVSDFPTAVRSALIPTAAATVKLALVSSKRSQITT